MRPGKIIFEVTEAVEGGYDARALGSNFFTQGEDWADLKAMVKDAILCHFEDDSMPGAYRLRRMQGLQKDESFVLINMRTRGE